MLDVDLFRGDIARSGGEDNRSVYWESDRKSPIGFSTHRKARILGGSRGTGTDSEGAIAAITVAVALVIRVNSHNLEFKTGPDGMLALSPATGANLRGVMIELLDSDRKTVSTTATDRDGLYLFDNVPPGYYQIRLGRDQKPSWRGYGAVPEFNSAVIPKEGAFESGKDFRIERVMERIHDR